MKQRWQWIKILRDFPPERVLGPVFRAGQEIYARVVEPPPGYGGWKGWYARCDGDIYEWALADGEDAVAVGPVEEG